MSPLLGRRDSRDGLQVTVIRGPCKSYRGLIKSTAPLRGLAIVELEATLRRAEFHLCDLLDVQT
jgi:hypothetical protein